MAIGIHGGDKGDIGPTLASRSNDFARGSVGGRADRHQDIRAVRLIVERCDRRPNPQDVDARFMTETKGDRLCE